MKELVESLVKKLGIEARQASGGAAVLFRAARSKLGPEEFARVAGSLPGIDELLRLAPPSGGLAKLFGGLAAAAGAREGAIVADIVSGFSSLGMSTADAKRFVPVISEYLHARLGPEAVAELESTLRA
jgi:hypothetical protein